MNRLAAALLLAVGVGCEVPPESPPGPAAGIQVIAVLPFADQTGRGGFDPDGCADTLASELVRLGFRVVRPAQVRAGQPAGESLRTSADAIRAGRRTGADAVLACAITEYDPYDPPRVAVLTQFLCVTPTPRPAGDLDRLLRSGSWTKGPLSMSPGGAAHALAAFEEVYDARDRDTRNALQSYALRTGAADAAFPAERGFLAVSPRYFRFVSFQILRRALEMACPHGT